MKYEYLHIYSISKIRGLDNREINSTSKYINWYI